MINKIIEKLYFLGFPNTSLFLIEDHHKPNNEDCNTTCANDSGFFV